jgi:excisionase family DNA binding protein
MTALANQHTFTVEQAARMLGIGRSACYAAVNRGEIPSLKIGRRRLVPRAKLEAMLGLSPEADPPGGSGP